MSVARKEIDYEEGLRLVPQLLGKGRLATAERWADHLCRHRPDDPRAHNQAGLVRQRQSRPQEAVARFRRALVLQPDAGEVWVNLGTALRHVAAFDEAFACRRRAAACRPDLPEVRLALGFGHLAAGDYRAGFAEYEHRSDRAIALRHFTKLGLRLWDGRVRAGGRLLLATEQGAGDVVQFLRFVQPIAAQGMEVTLACPPQLRRLVRTAPGVAGTTSVRAPDRPDAFDGVEMLLSLPARLGVELATLPAPHRYIEPPAHPHQLPVDGPLRVGLCWTGNTLTPLNTVRRIPFAELAPVLDTPGIAFYSLQVVVGLRESAGETRLIDLAPHIDDFADTVAMVDRMDLVITVDTSVAHIAGALGKPVWTLLAQIADWRWGQDGDVSPWYPSMRLFRQSRAGDWRGVVERVVAELRRLAADPVAAGISRPFASPDRSG